MWVEQLYTNGLSSHIGGKGPEAMKCKGMEISLEIIGGTEKVH